MGQLILCKIPRAKKPFTIVSGELNIYSLEELMYYVQSAHFVDKDDFMNESFIQWVEEELHLPQLASLLQNKLKNEEGLQSFFLPLEAANGYLTTSELQLLNVKLKKFQHMTGLEAKKKVADYLLEKEEYVKAIRSYRQLLEHQDVIRSQGHVAGDIWHNIGTSYARLLDYELAVDCYVKAYRLNHRNESLSEAVAAATLSGKERLMQVITENFQSQFLLIKREQERIQQMMGDTIERIRIATNADTMSIVNQWMEVYEKQCQE